MKLAIYNLSEEEVFELHSNLGGVLRCAGLPDGPVFDQTVADLFTTSSSVIDRHREQEQTRRGNLKLVKG